MRPLGLARPTEARHNKMNNNGKEIRHGHSNCRSGGRGTPYRQHRATGADRKDEVWDGVYVIMPDPNVEHQRLVMRLGVVFSEVVNPPAGGDVFPGLNLSDRAEDWKDNYRCPDVAVFLSGNTAQVFERIFAARPISWLRSSVPTTRPATSSLSTAVLGFANCW